MKRLLLCIVGFVMANMLVAQWPVGAAPSTQQGKTGTYPVITVDNVGQLAQVDQYGYGNFRRVHLSADGSSLYLTTDIGLWDFDPDNLQAPAQLAAPHQTVRTYSAFSADGSVAIVSNDQDQGAIWDATTGQVRHTLPLAEAGNVRLAINVDGTRAASWSRGGVLEAWDTATGQQLAQIEPDYENFVNNRQFGFSPDGTKLYTYQGTQIYAFDPVTGQQLAASETTEPVRGGLYIPATGDYLFTHNAAGTHALDVWDAETLAYVQPLVEKGEGLFYFDDVVLSPDGQYVMVGNAGIWDTTSLAFVTVPAFDSAGFTGLAFSPDGTRIAIDWGGTVRFYDFDAILAGTTPEPLAAHSLGSFPVVRSQGDYLAVLSSGGRQRMGVYTWANGEARSPELVFPTLYTDLELSQDGQFLFAMGAGRLQRFDLATGEVVESSAIGDHIALFPDDTRLVSGGANGKMALYDTQTLEELTTPEVEASILSLAMHPQGTQFAVAERGGLASLLDAEAFEPMASFETGGDVYAMAYHPDGTTLATSTSNGVRFWDTATGEEIADSLETRVTKAVLYTADGNKLLLGETRPQLVDLTDLTAEPVTFTPDAQVYQTHSLAHNEEVGLIFGVSFNGLLSVWDAETGETLRTDIAHVGTGGAEDLVMTPDGTMLITAAREGTIKFWAVVEE